MRTKKQCTNPQLAYLINGTVQSGFQRLISGGILAVSQRLLQVLLLLLLLLLVRKIVLVDASATLSLPSATRELHDPSSSLMHLLCLPRLVCLELRRLWNAHIISSSEAHVLLLKLLVLLSQELPAIAWRHLHLLLLLLELLLLAKIVHLVAHVSWH